MQKTSMVEAVRVLRDEVLDTAEHGDRDPPGAEVFDGLLAMLAVGGESAPGLDLSLHDAVSRRLAWGDTEEAVLADAERVFERVVHAAERAFRDPADQAAVLEAALQASSTVARVVSLAAVARAGRDRAARLREEMIQRQLREVLDRQRSAITSLEDGLGEDFG